MFDLPRGGPCPIRQTMTTTGGNQAILLLVELFVHPGRAAEFRRFETEAARIMRRHGGRIDRVIRPTGPARGDALPHEIHLVSFASAAGLEAYRADPELRALAPLREAAIARTEVTTGTDGDPYPEDPA
jgi:uncharacterized protein (DUF1330 family)